MEKLGEYPIVARFPNPVSIFSIKFYGVDDTEEGGKVYINVYNQAGSLISSITLDKVSTNPYYISTTEKIISGFSIHNSTYGGLAIHEIQYGIPEATMSYILYETGIGSVLSNDTPVEYSPGDSWIMHTGYNDVLTKVDGKVSPYTFDIKPSDMYGEFNTIYMKECTVKSGVLGGEDLLFFDLSGWPYPTQLRIGFWTYYWNYIAVVLYVNDTTEAGSIGYFSHTESDGITPVVVNLKITVSDTGVIDVYDLDADPNTPAATVSHTGYSGSRLKVQTIGCYYGQEASYLDHIYVS